MLDDMPYVQYIPTYRRGYKKPFRSCLDIDKDFEVEVEQPRQKEFEIFKAGFEAGRREQVDRDFPDVGLSLDRGPEVYWKDYLKNVTNHKQGK